MKLVIFQKQNKEYLKHTIKEHGTNSKNKIISYLEA
jgi:hypothetical protein